MSILHQGQPPSYQEAHILAQVQIAPAPVATIAATTTSNGTIAETDNSPTPALITVSQGSEVDPAVEEHKQAICRHPLFPLMAMVFEKCELASTSMDSFVGTDYDSDIQSFIEHGHQTKQTLYTSDADLDNLMLKAIQVLRIHLLELEKVGELCKDFCTRYIACLKGKLQSEHLLRLDDMDSPPLSPTSSSNATDWAGGAPAVGAMTPSQVGAVGGGMMVQQGLSMATISQGQIISGNMVYQMVHTPQGIVAQPIQIQAPPLQNAVGATSVIHGNTPLSQIGVVGSSVPSQPSTVPQPLNLSADESFDEEDPLGKRRNAKRGVLPKQATQIMKTWLFQHLVHPYPTEDEKRQIASQTNLTLLQVNNWFINARRRILQPMLDSGAGGESKVKKSKPVARPTQRFWPEAIANIQPQLPPHLQLRPPNAGDASGGIKTSPPSSPNAALVSTAVTAARQGAGAMALTALPPNIVLASASPPASAALTSPVTVVTTAAELSPESLVLSFHSEASSGD